MRGYLNAARHPSSGAMANEARIQSHAKICASPDAPVIIPLEDGDRAEALVRDGKKTVVIDLNPLSRSAVSGTVTVVDNIVRVMPLLIRKIKETAALTPSQRQEILAAYDNRAVLKEAEAAVRRHS